MPELDAASAQDSASSAKRSEAAESQSSPPSSPPAEVVNQRSPGSGGKASDRPKGGSSNSGRKGNRNQKGSGQRVVGFRLQASCMIYQVKSRISNLRQGDAILLENRNGEIVTGEVTHVTPWRGEESHNLFSGMVTRIVRRMTEQDRQAQDSRDMRERESYQTARELIREMSLPMKLSKVTLQGNSKALFFFTADNRVDFRELVKQLSNKLMMRVEMRQLGVRDESKLLGGVGPCGRSLCCAQHLDRFHPVSVKMAKNQELSLNPDAISGVCGRLMCCLAYEDGVYTDLRKDLPKPKSKMVLSSGEEVTIRVVHPLARTAQVQFDNNARRVIDLDEELAAERPGAAEAADAKGGEPAEQPGNREMAKPQRAARQATEGRTAQGEGGRKRNDRRPEKGEAGEGEEEGGSSGRRRRRRRRGKGDGGQQAAAGESSQQNQSKQTEGGKEAKREESKRDGAKGDEATRDGAKRDGGNEQGSRRRRRRRGRKSERPGQEGQAAHKGESSSSAEGGQSSPSQETKGRAEGAGETGDKRPRRRRRRRGKGSQSEGPKAPATQ
uniref:PSP1 C-terminal domain-containing protein n=1 Tax=Magnetococcus massalia (strain MO-1) TaxID=451514 RepID=A0A1S7LGV1_MAGMO|nr:conserved protein of unknown fuction with a N-terminal PSP1 domain [Candidatus Magnetococcus massalia]